MPYPELFLIAIVAWALSEIIGTNIVPAIRRRGTQQTGRAPGGGRFIFLILIVGIFVVVSLSKPYPIVSLPLWIGYVGVAMIFVGIAIRQYAIAVLGRFFSTVVRAIEGHRIVTAGPYRFVRHPSYTGLFIIIFGLGLTTGTLIGFLIIFVLGSLALSYRIRVEEKFLVGQFGSQYTEYKKRTKYLIPFVL